MKTKINPLLIIAAVIILVIGLKSGGFLGAVYSSGSIPDGYSSLDLTKCQIAAPYLSSLSSIIPTQFLYTATARDCSVSQTRYAICDDSSFPDLKSETIFVGGFDTGYVTSYSADFSNRFGITDGTNGIGSWAPSDTHSVTLILNSFAETTTTLKQNQVSYSNIFVSVNATTKMAYIKDSSGTVLYSASVANLDFNRKLSLFVFEYPHLNDACPIPPATKAPSDGWFQLANVAKKMPVCTSFTYSSWSLCQANNKQVRTIATSLPSGCTGGNPILEQTCTYVPPVTTCTSFTYSAWGTCQANSQQTRTLSSSLPSGCTGGTPVLVQACTYVAPVIPCTSWTYSSWSLCQTNNQQARTILTSSPTSCTGGSPVLSQTCTYVAPTTNTTTTVVETPQGGGGGGSPQVDEPIQLIQPVDTTDTTTQEIPWLWIGIALIVLFLLFSKNTKIVNVRSRVKRIVIQHKRAP
jgi:hypothetical protein